MGSGDDAINFGHEIATSPASECMGDAAVSMRAEDGAADAVSLFDDIPSSGLPPFRTDAILGANIVE